MSTSKLTGLLCVTLCIIFSKVAVSQNNSGAFTFKLSNSARTSAGVYKKDSTLVRTLWANKTYSAGTYTEYWDGKDDYGKSISSPDANYDIKILSNNVSYNWDGIIGNTSDSLTGATVHRGYYTSMTGIAITGTTAYFCQGYSEGYSSQAKFDIGKPQMRITLSGFGGSVGSLNTDFVATDGTNVYWAGYNAYSTTNSFTMATKVSDDSQVSFGGNGTAYTMTHLGNAKVYTSVIDKLNVSNSKPTGLAVQGSGSYLFIAHGGLNELHVLDKTTGALVQNLTYTNPRFICVDGSSLWMVTSTNTIAKYIVNSNGTLTSALLTLSGVTMPGALQANGAGTIAVIDQTNQVVRFFNTSTGVEGTQVGTNGGYSLSPVVTNTKFFFNDFRGNIFSFLAFAPDGSFWVGDPGNYRELHYNSSKAWIETIMSMGVTYSTSVDPNNINRVFANYLEFAIDYSQPLTGSTGWSLVKNWGYGRDEITNPNITRKLLNVTTLSNGRTYGYDYNTGAGLMELTSTGLRKTNVSIGNGVINTDGSLTGWTGADNFGSTITLLKYPLTGFDGSGNPIWSSTGTVLSTTPVQDAGLSHPIERPGLVSPASYNVVTASGKVIWYAPQTLWQNGGAGPYSRNGYHLGAIKLGQSSFSWETQKSDHINYAGAFPGADYFEIGNSVNNYAGSNVNVVDNNIITGYHGEAWKNAQTNYYNHYWEDGLAVGQFGTDRYISSSIAGYGVAGNALNPIVVKNNVSGNLYLYHGDEANHGGMHRWSITSLNSISEQSINVPFPSTNNRIAIGYLDLHAGLPFYSPLPNSAGWSKAGTITSNTSLKKYIDDGSPDVYSIFNQTTGTASITRDLGINNVSKSWKISGQLSFEGSDFVTGSHIISYVDVLDALGKILTRFNYVGNPNTKVITIYANNVIIANTTGLSGILSKYQPFEVAIVNGQVSFTYANLSTVVTSLFDATANWKQPKTLRQYFVTGGAPAYNKNIGFIDMKFYKDYIQAINIPPMADAGADQSITLPLNTVTLSGNGADADGTIISYAWSKISGPSSGTITNSNNATTTVTGLVQGTYNFELKVTDNSGAMGADTMQVIVNIAINIPPVANAGTDQAITLPINVVTLNGSGTDADGIITKYSWTKISGPSSGAITISNNATTTVTGLVKGTYNFKLKVTDNSGASAVDTVQILVTPPANIPPVANAGMDQVITLPNNVVSLAGSGGDADGSIVAYAWTKISGRSSFSIVNSFSPVTDIFGLIGGVYSFELKVTDNSGAIARDTMQITVNLPANISPVVDAGTDQMLILPKNRAPLDGTANDPDGTVVSYSWKEIAGPPSAIIANANAANTVVGNFTQGDYLFELSVTDDLGGVGKDTVQITVVASSLPLKLLSFTGKIQNDFINLFWETTNEKNVLRFEIERMSAATWNKIGFVAVNNSGLINNQYAFTDSLPSIGSNYYRLKIIDSDGKFVYSAIISFEVNPSKNLIYQNFPNPFSNFTTIKFEIAQKSSVKVIVYNSIGMQVEVLSNEIKLPGVFQITWNASNAVQGDYFYKVIVGETIVTNKMLKLY